jgi:hypothetical protein
MIEQTVILDAYQWARASAVGTLRDTSSKLQGQQGRAGQSSDRSLQNHIDGAAAELAVCIALGLPWAAHVDTYLSEPDVEVPWLGGVEVKWTASTGLIVRENEQREQIHVLVTGNGPVKRIVGWLDVEGLRALKASPKTDFGNGRAPAWLKPIEELNDWGLFPKKEAA